MGRISGVKSVLKRENSPPWGKGEVEPAQMANPAPITDINRALSSAPLESDSDDARYNIFAHGSDHASTMNPVPSRDGRGI
jgi:hypothetical protein